MVTRLHVPGSLAMQRILIAGSKEEEEAIHVTADRKPNSKEGPRKQIEPSKVNTSTCFLQLVLPSWHLQTLLKLVHRLGTKDSNTWDCQDTFYPNYNKAKTVFPSNLWMLKTTSGGILKNCFSVFQHFKI